MIPVVFCKWGYANEVAAELGDCYILQPDNWDDYGYKTYFKVSMYKDGESYGTYGRRILFENQDAIHSSSGFVELMVKHKYIHMNKIFKEFKYISLGSDYEALKKIFSENDYLEILNVLNDVIFLEHTESERNIELLKLKSHKAFDDSLCRDQSSKKVLEEGKNILFGEELDENRFAFTFNFELSDKQYQYAFDFNQHELPSRINILIGKNGSGKSQSLLALSEYLLDNDEHQIDKHPSFFSHMLVFAYNQHENFVVPKSGKKYDIEYKYVGYKRQRTLLDIEPIHILHFPNLYFCLASLNDIDLLELSTNIIKAKNVDQYHWGTDEQDKIKIDLQKKSGLSKEQIDEVWEIFISTLEDTLMDVDVPKQTLYQSFAKIYQKDQINFEKSIQIDDIVYIEKMFEHLQKAFECNAIGLKLLDIRDKEKYELHGFDTFEDYILVKAQTDKKQYAREINFDQFEEKLHFFNNGYVHLSSGQQTFADFIINIMSLIKLNSLILIDEPENTLHPNLEVDFMNILQNILNDFESFSIIATHSAVIAREVPETSVYIIKYDDLNQPDIKHPTIRTFGADIGTITNYVFDDIFKVDKPFKIWFKNEKNSGNYASFEEFERKYHTILNYDFLLFCKNAWDR